MLSIREHLEIDGKKLFINSGEVQYYRVPASRWEYVIDKARRAGINVISTYIPWRWHEISRGRYDFEGRTHERRNLIGFLELCRSKGLYMILRPGPNITNEAKLGGYPERVIREHPEILALDCRGKSRKMFGFYPVISYLHPSHLSEISDWYDGVCGAIVPHLITNGGNAIMVQADNETCYSFCVGTFSCDYNPFVVGKNGRGGIFQQWLSERYSIQELNLRYGSRYSDFSEVQPPRSPPASVEDYRRVIDWSIFKQDVIVRYLQILCGMLRERGVDVPLITNEPTTFPPSMRTFPPSNWKQKSKILLDTIDLYYYHINLDSATKIIMSARMMQAFQQKLLMVEETQTGWFTPFPYIHNSDLELLYMLLISIGCNGINAYMFSGGINPGRFGFGYSPFFLGPLYDFQAPLDSFGGVRAKYGIICKIGKLVSSERLVESRYVCDASLGFSTHYMELMQKELGNLNDVKVSRERARMLRAFFKILLEYGYSPGLIDVDEDISVKTLVLLSPRIMPRRSQEKISRFVKDGGKLIIFPEPPSVDEDLEICSTLSSLIECRLGGKLKGKVKVGGEEFSSEAREILSDGEPVAECGGRVCGVRKKAGDGEIVFLSFIPHPRVLELLGLRREIVRSDRSVLCFKRKGENDLIFAMNLSYLGKEVEIESGELNIKLKLGGREAAVLSSKGPEYERIY